MKVGMIGLGKMGYNLALNMRDNGFDVYGFDVNGEIKERADQDNIAFFPDYHNLLSALGENKVIWVMLPAGKITNRVLEDLLNVCQEGDIIIDGGNSDYRDSMKFANRFYDRGSYFFDVGTSGGVTGAREGASFTIGGDETVFKTIEPLFQEISQPDGYLYTGTEGSGHYVKLIHNAILYGMMQVIGEGFELLHRSQFNYDLHEVANVWNKSAVIRGWLMELTANALDKHPNLEDIIGEVSSSKSNKWVLESAFDLGVPTPVISLATHMRFLSKQDDSFAAKVISSLRDEVGGHKPVTATSKS